MLRCCTLEEILVGMTAYDLLYIQSDGARVVPKEIVLKLIDCLLMVRLYCCCYVLHFIATIVRAFTHHFCGCDRVVWCLAF